MADARRPHPDSNPLPLAPLSPRKPRKPLRDAVGERRANLIFITILALLMSPAVVITVVKFVKGIHFSRPLTPPAARGQFAYMDTTPSLIGIPRVTPPMTGDFVAHETDGMRKFEPGLRSIVAQGDFRPVMSDALHVQLVALGPGPTGYQVGIIGWNDRFAPIPSIFHFVGHRTDGSVTVGEMRAYEDVNLPLEIREELMDYGYVKPPAGIVWAIVYFDGSNVPVKQVDIGFKGNGLDLSDTLRIPPEVIDPDAPVSQPASQPAILPAPAAK